MVMVLHDLLRIVVAYLHLPDKIYLKINFQTVRPNDHNYNQRFGLRAVNQYFLGQFLNRPLMTAEITHSSILGKS